MPKDVQLSSCEVEGDVPMNLPGYQPSKHPNAKPEQIRQIAAAIKHSKRPVIYCGGGVVNGEAAAELRSLIEATGIPVTMTVMDWDSILRMGHCRWTCWACTVCVCELCRSRL